MRCWWMRVNSQKLKIHMNTLNVLTSIGTSLFLDVIVRLQWLVNWLVEMKKKTSGAFKMWQRNEHNLFFLLAKIGYTINIRDKNV